MYKVETLQNQIALLNRAPEPSVHNLASTLISIPNTWANATSDERRELVRIIFDEIGCNLQTKMVEWVEPQKGFLSLFQLIKYLIPTDYDQFVIRDRKERKSRSSHKCLTMRKGGVRMENKVIKSEIAQVKLSDFLRFRA